MKTTGQLAIRLPARAAAWPASRLSLGDATEEPLALNGEEVEQHGKS